MKNAFNSEKSKIWSFGNKITDILTLSLLDRMLGFLVTIFCLLAADALNFKESLSLPLSEG